MKRFAISLAIERQEKMLFCVRLGQSYEFPHAWSIPTKSIEKNVFSNLIKGKFSFKEIVALFEGKVNNLKLKRIQVVKTGSRVRKDYELYIALLLCKVEHFEISTSKYKKLAFLSIKEFIDKSEGIAGACTSLLLQYLIEQGKLSSTIQYLELSPYLYNNRNRLKEFTCSELWKLAIPNYRKLLENESGSDGLFIRKISLERFFDKLIDEKISRGNTVLDIGSIDGFFLKRISRSTTRIWGLEPYLKKEDLKNSFKEKIKQGEIKDALDLFGNKRFDWIFLNNVIQWLPDIALATSVISQLLKKGGCIIVSCPTPEFSKNGYWIKEKGEHKWVIEKKFDRPPFLTMINRVIGPVRFFPRSSETIINSFCEKGLSFKYIQNIYFDSFTTEIERAEILIKYPDMDRHLLIPFFSVYIFEKGKKI